MNKKIEDTLKYLEENGNYGELKKYIQHNNYTTYQHCIDVCERSIFLADKFHIKCNYDELIIAALLHDYYLYDWHVKDKTHSLHGFKHGTTAMINAANEYKINENIQLAIKRHMFPLTPTPPTSKIGIIITVADKICTIKEVFIKNKLLPKMQ